MTIISHNTFNLKTFLNFKLSYIRKLKNKKSFTNDGITSLILKRYIDIFTPILCKIFNKCVSLSIFPTLLKKTTVIPLFKSGLRNDFGNYRPISLLSNISKLFEKVIFDRMLCFIESINIIHHNQYGFMKKRSCNDAVLHLTEYITKKLDKRLKCLTIFLDLKKAFDTVNHNFLIQKLYYMGFRSNFLKLIESYLYNRQQCVKINNNYSEFNVIESGIPQGSVLGPLLFILYINDIFFAIKNCEIICYADDTSLTLCSNSMESLLTKANLIANQVYIWLSSNLLSLNISKSKIIMYSWYKNDDFFDKIIIHNNNCTNFVNCDCHCLE